MSDAVPLMPAPIAPERKPLDPPGARRGVPMQMPTEPTIDSLRDVEERIVGQEIVSVAMISPL